MKPRAFLHRALFAVIIALPALLLLAAACGGDDSSGQTKTPAGTTNPDATKTEAASDNTGASGGDASSELKNLSQDWSKTTAKVSYEFQSTSEGTTTTTNMTFYSKPPDSRIDYEDASTGKAIFITSGGKTYICSESDGQGSCFESASDGNSNPLPFFGDFADPEAIDSAVGDILGASIDSSDETIAGQDAKCFTASGSFTAEQGDAKWCFANDGLLLSASFSGGNSGGFSMTATAVDRSVSDSDLKPPYDVVTIPGQ